MQFSDLCELWKIASGAWNLVLQALQFQQIDKYLQQISWREKKKSWI
jgi:hypothetical protein